MTWKPADSDAANLAELFKERMKPTHKVFLHCWGGRDITFARLWDMAGQMAAVLESHGVRRGDRVAVQVEKSAEAIALYLACVRAGSAFLPLNTGYTRAEVEYFVSDASPRVVVCAPDRLEDLSDFEGRFGVGSVLSLGTRRDGSLANAAERQDGSRFEDAATAWSDMAAILYTSGTTGRSKGAMLTQANLASNALTLADFWRFTHNDVLLHMLPVYHVHGLFTATNTLLVAGGSMIFRERFDANEAMSLLPQATTMMGVPTFYTRLLQHPGLTRASTSHMRLFISGSAPLLAETHREFRERTGLAILERYGMTETGMNTSNPYDGDRRAGTVGFPLPGISVRVTDPQSGDLLAPGEIGMLEVRGPNVFSGYWQMPEKTRSEFRPDGYFITGDLGMIDADGYVSIVGRGKDLIITGGFNVYPKEIEGEIDALTGVTESAVIGLPHPDFGEGVTAVLVASDPELDEDAVLRQIKDRLAKFKLPKRVLFVPELPRNAMGKIQKAALRESYAKLYAQ